MNIRVSSSVSRIWLIPWLELVIAIIFVVLSSWAAVAVYFVDRLAAYESYLIVYLLLYYFDQSE